MSEPQEPRTAAGRAHAEFLRRNSIYDGAKRVLTIEADAAALDVERLARAMDTVSRNGGVTVTWGNGPDSVPAQIAAEYARLAAEAGT